MQIVTKANIIVEIIGGSFNGISEFFARFYWHASGDGGGAP